MKVTAFNLVGPPSLDEGVDKAYLMAEVTVDRTVDVVADLHWYPGDGDVRVSFVGVYDDEGEFVGLASEAVRDAVVEWARFNPVLLDAFSDEHRRLCREAEVEARS